MKLTTAKEVKEGQLVVWCKNGKTKPAGKLKPMKLDDIARHIWSLKGSSVRGDLSLNEIRRMVKDGQIEELFIGKKDMKLAAAKAIRTLLKSLKHS